MTDAKIIKNINIPSCRNCIHYKPLFYTDFSSGLAKCEFFGKKDIQTDVISYDYATSCREDEEKCGLNGKYFEKDKNIELKILLHTIIRYLPFNLYLIIIIISIYNGRLK
jgi:hypothetical protein